jgi:hypothetical protein
MVRIEVEISASVGGFSVDFGGQEEVKSLRTTEVQ